jgi:hypothetical protein
LFCGSAWAAEPVPAERTDILKLIELSGNRDLARRLLQQYAKQSLSLVKKLRPDIPASSLPTVERELQTIFAEKLDAPGGLLEQVAAVYARHFTPEEIRQMLAFYQSPVGRKAVGVMPQLMRESQDAAQRLGLGLLPEINRRVNEALKREAEAKG